MRSRVALLLVLMAAQLAEPGIYIPQEKIGVRMEDTFYVDASGKLIDFAEKLPHTAEEVEAAMQAR